MTQVDAMALVVGSADDPLRGLAPDAVRRILDIPFTAEERGRLAMARAAPAHIREFILEDILVRRRLKLHTSIMETDMTEATDKQKGTIRAFLNPDKVPGDDKPAFTGTLSFPGEEKERNFALWSRPDKNGAVILSGHTSVVSGSAMEQITGLTPGRQARQGREAHRGEGGRSL